MGAGGVKANRSPLSNVGETNSVPQALRDKPRYWDRVSTFITIVWVVIFVIPMSFSLLNYAVPDESELTTLTGEVVKVSKRPPQILLRTSMGEEVSLHFPDLLLPGNGGLDHSAFGPRERSIVLGCKRLTVRVVPLKYSPVEVNRIWDLRCDYRFRIDYRSLREGWEQRRDRYHQFTFVFGFFALGLFTSANAIGIRRRYYEQK